MSGAGASAVGGRWNSPGHPVVYASGNLSLAMLELLVHVDDSAQIRNLPFVYCSIRFPIDAIAILTQHDVPTGWDSRPESGTSQLVGDEWLESRASAVLAVPSVVTPLRFRYVLEYMNFLINPQHPDFVRLIQVDEAHDLDLDPRLI